MYSQHFNLEKKPFQINSDNEFLWLGEKHAIALESLKNGVEEEQGLLALTGDVGTGKTTLLNEIIHTLDAKTLFVKIADPGVEMHHLFLTISQAFGFENQYQKRGKFSSVFYSFLKTAGDKGKKVLVLVDEAQRIPQRFLKEIASWSEFGLNQALTIILAGQLEFDDILRSTLGTTWQDTIKVHAFLEPLNEEETKIYINKRLEKAGTTRKIFIIPAAHEVYTYSKGFPRMINILCDQALIAAFAKGMKIIDTPTVKQVIGQLDLPYLPSKTEEEKKRPGENTFSHGRPRFPKKTMAGLAAAACIGLAIGYLFHNGYLPYTMPTSPSAQPVDMKPMGKNPKEKRPPTAIEAKNDFKDTGQNLNRTIQPSDTKTRHPEDKKLEGRNIGLGYTPAPFPEEKKLPSPVLIENIVKISRKAKDSPKNMDWFIKEVFQFEEQTIEITKPSIKSKTDMGQLPKPTSYEQPGHSLDDNMNASPDASKEPAPDDIIDWLFKKRNIE